MKSWKGGTVERFDNRFIYVNQLVRSKLNCLSKTKFQEKYSNLMIKLKYLSTR